MTLYGVVPKKRRNKMGLTHFPNGVSSFGIPLYGSGFGAPLGLGTGDVKYVVASKVSTNLYYEKLKSNGIKDTEIYTTVTSAYNATTGGQNDVVAVTPGAYLETEELAWSKANTHLVGLGGPNTGGDWSEPNVVIYTTGTAVASVITVTGANCQFYNCTVSNYGNNAACLTAFTLNTYGCYFANMTFQGHMTAGNDDTVAASSLAIGGAGMYPIFDNCTIGQDVWDEREGANSGVLRFTSAGRPNKGLFRGCIFLSRSITAEVAMVAVPTNTFIGRGWVFDNCIFSNFYDGVTLLNQVFYTVTGTQQFTIQLHRCTAIGFTEWQTGDFSVVVADMPITGLGGGLMRQPTAAVGN